MGARLDSDNRPLPLPPWKSFVAEHPARLDAAPPTEGRTADSFQRLVPTFRLPCGLNDVIFSESKEPYYLTRSILSVGILYQLPLCVLFESFYNKMKRMKL